MKPYKTIIPPDSLIATEHQKVDYQDAFGIQLPRQYAIPPEKLVKLFFDSFPKWGQILLGIREFLAARVGLKTANGIDIKRQIHQFEGQPGQSIALFHVRERSEKEILTGETDDHLDFSLSFIGNKNADHFEVILATTVIYNNWMGKIYFFFVKPIHQLLVPAMLKKMAKKLVTNTSKLQSI